MNLQEQWNAFEMDTSLIGLKKGDAEGGYFCTPVGAKVIGWEGVDGIHYCFIEGFGEMVFAVNPMSGADQYVYPLARDFETFLRMILASGSAAALEQIISWSKEQFEAFVAESKEEREEEVKHILHMLEEKFNLLPQESTYEQVKELQAGFAYEKLVFTEEYYDMME